MFDLCTKGIKSIIEQIYCYLKKTLLQSILRFIPILLIVVGLVIVLFIDKNSLPEKYSDIGVLLIVVGVILSLFKKVQNSDPQNSTNCHGPSSRNLLQQWYTFLLHLDRDFRRVVLLYQPFVVMGEGDSHKTRLIKHYSGWEKVSLQFTPNKWGNESLQIYIGEKSVTEEISHLLLDDISKQTNQALENLWKPFSAKRNPIALAAVLQTSDNNNAQKLEKQAIRIRNKIDILSTITAQPIATRIALTGMEEVTGYQEFAAFMQSIHEPLQISLPVTDINSQQLNNAIEPWQEFLPNALISMTNDEYEKIVFFLEELPSLLDQLCPFLKALTLPSISYPLKTLDLYLTSDLKNDYAAQPFACNWPSKKLISQSIAHYHIKYFLIGVAIVILATLPLFVDIPKIKIDFNNQEVKSEIQEEVTNAIDFIKSKISSPQNFNAAIAKLKNTIESLRTNGLWDVIRKIDNSPEMQKVLSKLPSKLQQAIKDFKEIDTFITQNRDQIDTYIELLEQILSDITLRPYGLSKEELFSLYVLKYSDTITKLQQNTQQNKEASRFLFQIVEWLYKLGLPSLEQHIQSIWQGKDDATNIEQQIASLTTLFPFNSKSENNITTENLNTLFQPRHGTFFVFDKKILQAVTTRDESGKIIPKTMFATTIQITDSILSAKNQFTGITQALWNQKGQIVPLEFTLTLQQLPANIESLFFSIDDNNITLTPAQQTTLSVAWPGTTSKLTANYAPQEDAAAQSIVLAPAQNYITTPWSFFHLLYQGSIEGNIWQLKTQNEVINIEMSPQTLTVLKIFLITP